MLNPLTNKPQGLHPRGPAMNRRLVVDLDHEALHPLVPKWLRHQADLVDRQCAVSIDLGAALPKEQSISQALRYLADMLEDAYAEEPIAPTVSEQLIDDVIDGIARRGKRRGLPLPEWLQ